MNDLKSLLGQVDVLRGDMQRLVNRLHDSPAPVGLESVWHLLTNVQRQLIVNALPTTPAPPAPTAPKSDAEVVQALADLVTLSRQTGYLKWMPRAQLRHALGEAVGHVYIRPSSVVGNASLLISAIVAGSTNGSGSSVADVARRVLA